MSDRDRRAAARRAGLDVADTAAQVELLKRSLRENRLDPRPLRRRALAGDPVCQEALGLRPPGEIGQRLEQFLAGAAAPECAEWACLASGVALAAVADDRDPDRIPRAQAVHSLLHQWLEGDERQRREEDLVTDQSLLTAGAESLGTNPRLIMGQIVFDDPPTPPVQAVRSLYLAVLAATEHEFTSSGYWAHTLSALLMACDAAGEDAVLAALLRSLP